MYATTRTAVKAGAVLVLAAACFATVAAAAGNPSELPQSYLLSGLPAPAPRAPGHLTQLRAEGTYKASQFPLPLTLTRPGAGWAGAQWKSARLGWRGGGGPFFGWVAIGQRGGAVQNVPRGLVLIMTAYAQTPSVATTVARLRRRGLWASYETTSPAKVAGFAGVQFDGQVAAGRIHVFAPFSDTNHFEDAFLIGGSELFRVIVLNVRGKAVVVYIDSAALAADQFPAFLAKANRTLASLRFPK